MRPRGQRKAPYSRRQCPSSARTPPRGTPGGFGQLEPWVPARTASEVANSAALRACRHDDSFTPLAKALADNAAQIEKVCSRSRLGGDGRLPCNRVRWGLHPALGPHAVALFVAQELIDCQGPAVDLGGYWQPDPAKVKAAMNPSPTLNKILTDMA